MNETERNQLKSRDGLTLKLHDYEIHLIHGETRTEEWVVHAAIMKRQLDRSDSHVAFNEEDLDQLIQDLKDLEDWRAYRKLRNKLNSV